MKYKIAIIGGTGLLGSNLLKLYSSHDVISFSRMNAMNIDNLKNVIINFSFLDRDLTKYFVSWKPDIIINAVGLINLQLCEENFSLAYDVNVRIAKELALISSKLDTYFIHISTDHYYNDLKIKHNEKDEVLFLNYYSKTKYEAEIEVLKNHKKALVVRTNIIGFRNNNVDSFFEWLLKSMIKQDSINLFSNFYTSPISVREFGSILLKCFEKKLEGIYNISSSEVMDKYNFGIKIANRFEFTIANINKLEIKQNSASNLKRSLTLGLDVSKIESALDFKMPTISETVDSLYYEYKGK
ncbi:SDR family oxidoreductase [Sulfurimonas sp.]|uniref:dTDP-4-dehydrorhamnose reductase family protein n=1 Tax=Sulfurimonas sp. TaxID=2022749 RepID=UPI002AAF2D93|nr:SDR family oxidoreductase [Sulfurimonas sp.]